MNNLTRNPLNRVWFILISLTLLTAAIPENDSLTTASAAFISVLVIIKGRLIIRDYMDMKKAHPILYWSLVLYMVLFSIAMLVIPAIT